MSIAFVLTPEGQAWNDYEIRNNPDAVTSDLSTPFFTGITTALPRGIIEGAVGLDQSVSKGLSNLFGGDSNFIGGTFESMSRRFEETRQILKPDEFSQGTAAQVVNGLGKYVPAIGAAIVSKNAAVGASVAGIETYEPAKQDLIKKNVDDKTASRVAFAESLANAAGFALPAGVGSTLVSRVGSGVAINASFGMGSRYASGTILETNGYKDMASQYKVWDSQAIIIDSVLGAAFGFTHHLGSPKVKTADIDAAQVLNEGRNYDLDSSPVIHSEPSSMNAHDAAMEKAAQQLMEGEPVNVHDEVQGIDGIAKPDEASFGREYQNDMGQVFKDNDIDYSISRPDEVYSPDINSNSHFARVDNIEGKVQELIDTNSDVTIKNPVTGEEVTLKQALANSNITDLVKDYQSSLNMLFERNNLEAGQPRARTADISRDIETGEVISSNGYDLLQARDLASNNPELSVIHPDTGEYIPLTEALAQLDEQIATAKKEAGVFEVAASCFLRNS